MGLKKLVKKITSNPVGTLINPAWNASAELINKGGNWIGSVGKEEGPKNPYAPPNLDYLRQPLNTGPAPSYDFLKSPVNLTSTYKGYNDFYKAPTMTSDGTFKDYIGNINAPSSVDAVRGGLNQEQLDLLLNNIQTDTRQRFGQNLMDEYNLGRVGPGVSSDISANNLAQTASSGADRAAQARLSYSMADLERQAAREAAAREAYGKRYNNSFAYDTQAADLASRGAISDTSNYKDLLTTGADINAKNQLSYADLISGNYNSAADRTNARDIAYATGSTNLYNNAVDMQNKYKKGSYLDNILRNTQVSVSPKF